MIQYILECIAFQLVFLVIYDFFLKRETFFQWNRAYLIGTYILSLLLPWIKIEAFKTAVPERFYVYPEFLWNTNDAAATLTAPVTAAESPLFQISGEVALLASGMVLASVLFIYKLYQIRKLRQNGTIKYFPNFTRIVVENSQLAFSFFKSIFLGDKVLAREHQSIIQHELVHIEQWHTIDLLFFELMRIIGWFNPLVYVYQNRISELHEFIADAHVAKTHKKEQYEFLLSEVFQTENISFVNQFFKGSLIIRRIVMLQKAKSKKIWQLKYLLLAPLLLGMLLYTSSEAQETKTAGQEQTSDDEVLIERLNAKIEKEIEKLGSIGKVHRNFSSQHYKGSEETILSKEAFFEGELIADKHYSQYADSLVKAKTPFFRRGRFPKRPLPSTVRYESYVQYTEAFQILDKNLRFSITANLNNEGVGVRLIDSKENHSNEFNIFKVNDVKDLTGMEVGAFNNKLEDIFMKNDSDYTGLILTDSKYGFEIFASEPYDSVDKTIDSRSIDDGKIGTEEIDQDIETIPFAEVDQVPVFPNCEDDDDKRGCFYESMREHIRKNFRYPQEAQEKGIQGRVSVMFTIDEDGNIVDFRKRGPDKVLEDEAERIIDKLPRMQPGRYKGKPVKVPFSIPISFHLGDNEKAAYNVQAVQDIDVPFAIVDEVPVFPGCDDADDKRACFRKSIQKHISKNFAYPKEAQEQGIQGLVSIMFTINTDGDIGNIRMRGPDKMLEEEAKRIISLLPKMKPGKHDGKFVRIPFMTPIRFEL